MEIKNLKSNFRRKYNNHIKKMHKFIQSFDIKDKYGKIVQSGYEYISDIQKKVIDKYHDEKYIEQSIGNEKWEYYKKLMKREKDLRERETKIGWDYYKNLKKKELNSK